MSEKQKPLVIAIDGPAGSGKGLISEMLASELDLTYLPSSKYYRAAAYLCSKHNIANNDFGKIHSLLENNNLLEIIEKEDLSSEEIGDAASKISTLPELRKLLNQVMTNEINQHSRIVIEGRDITTIVKPDADLKIFLTADIKIRAKRRSKQLQSHKKGCSIKNVLEKIETRDRRDMTRNDGPLMIASDAIVIDSSDLQPDEVISKIKDCINKLDSKCR